MSEDVCRRHRPADAQQLVLLRLARERLTGVLRAKLDTSEPYHRFAGVLFKTAADPASPLNPFSPESEPVRRQAIELFAEVVSGADSRLTPELTAALPNLLWTYQMGIILFWIHDTSPGCARSYLLMERSVKPSTVPLALPQSIYSPTRKASSLR